MKNEKIVTINGQQYNANTGLPTATKKTLRSNTDIKRVHSVTRNIKPVSKSLSKKSDINSLPTAKRVGRNMDIARSKNISHFSPRPIKKIVKPINKTMKSDIGPVKHPIAAKIEKGQIKQSKPLKSITEKTSKQIKDELIEKALNKPTTKPVKTSLFKKRHKMINLTSLGVAIVLIIGYFTYINIPSLSVQVASAQAGMKATFPEYHPDGYSTDGPVRYSAGEVVINFSANTGKGKFNIKQSKSSWDSSAVKNAVNKKSNGEFITNEDHGLTIYTYNGNATWVNGGILYTISSDAHLSSDQIRRIAISL